jgi:hypothetical protein
MKKFFKFQISENKQKKQKGRKLDIGNRGKK